MFEHELNNTTIDNHILRYLLKRACITERDEDNGDCDDDTHSYSS